jgi:hypothetical protein
MACFANRLSPPSGRKIFLLPNEIFARYFISVAFVLKPLGFLCFRLVGLKKTPLHIAW